MSTSTVWKFEWCILISATKINILRKKNTFFAKIEANIYNLVLSEDDENTWKIFHEKVIKYTNHVAEGLTCIHMLASKINIAMVIWREKRIFFAKGGAYDYNLVLSEES